MAELLLNLALVLLFVLIGGVFAASETALVTLRESQVEAMAGRGKSGERVKRLTSDSNRFLSSVQIGVTLAGFFSASYGAATIAPLLSPTLAGWGLPQGAAATIAFVGTTVAIAYLSLVLGELVPKRLAMQDSERVSALVAGPLDAVATVLRPVIWLLGASTDLVLRLLRLDPDAQRVDMNAEELRAIVSSHGELLGEERDMVVDLLEAGERSVAEIMTPRTEVTFLDAAVPVPTARALVHEFEHSRYPVCRVDHDDVIGFVHVRDLFAPEVDDKVVGQLVREVVYLPSSKSALSALTELRARQAHLAVVLDEYGGTDGVVTMEDVIEEFVGEIEDEYDQGSPYAPAPGLVEGLTGRGDIVKLLGTELPDGEFDTLGGFIMAELGRVPQVGDRVVLGDYAFIVDTMDARRVDAVRVRRIVPIS
ncbi:MAG: hemolysin family protein [Dermatophilus congolensis]|nr:hemolysin family protein [Dermatophilus congolensis]